ncbi:MAG: class I SAM-dependent methyltransferase [Acidobacteriaceae bacterium]
MHATQRYIPALRFHCLTPFFDPLLSIFMREEVFKRRLIVQAGLRPGMHLLDVGCGTGTLVMMIKQAYPQVEVSGLDADPEILAMAKKKVARAGSDVNLDQGMAYSLPYPGNFFDRVLSSMVMHHLTREDKIRTFREIHRVLRLEGELHLVDFGPPTHLYTRLSTMVLQQFEEVEDNINGKLAGFIRSAGFALAIQNGHYDTLFGTLTFYKAIK